MLERKNLFIFGLILFILMISSCSLLNPFVVTWTGKYENIGTYTLTFTKDKEFSYRFKYSEEYKNLVSGPDITPSATYAEYSYEHLDTAIIYSSRSKFAECKIQNDTLTFSIYRIFKN